MIYNYNRYQRIVPQKRKKCVDTALALAQEGQIGFELSDGHLKAQ